MANTYSMLFAGFGGQGLLFAGKLAVTAGLIEGREVTWLPSYGPEMRGGTANCSVVISDEPIGSPLVVTPEVLVAMNQPSVDKFIGDVVSGGLVIVDSTLVPRIPTRNDVKLFAIPATQMAEDAGLKGLANVILTGKVLKETGFCAVQSLEAAIDKSVPARKAAMVEANKQALRIGLES